MAAAPLPAAPSPRAARQVRGGRPPPLHLRDPLVPAAPFEPASHPWRRTREQRWHLLFESNFDGDWDEYLAAFGTVLGPDLGNLLRPALGYPGMEDLGLFKAWAAANDRVPEHYVSAYPDLTAIGIRQLLHRVEGPAARAAVIAEGYGRSSPTWSTFVLPLVPGRASGAVRAARPRAHRAGGARLRAPGGCG